jgi:Uma2 family endonuclease
MMPLMNTSAPAIERTTTAAEGLPRRRFTVAEVERMTAAGILDEDERIELIGGELVPMSPKGNQHEILKTALNLYWVPRLPADVQFTTETTFRLSTDTYLEPDFAFYPKAVGLRGLSAATALLVVEIADSSLGYDLGRKAALYASFGLVELWVIDAVRLATHVHREPTAAGYRSIAEFPSTHRLCPHFAPALSVVLADLDLR